MRTSRKRRIRLHMLEDGLPSIEGLLMSRRHREYLVAIPRLLVHPERDPVELADARLVAVPRDRVAFYEVLR